MTLPEMMQALLDGKTLIAGSMYTMELWLEGEVLMSRADRPIHSCQLGIKQATHEVFAHPEIYRIKE
jgi:hypothetical protein